MYIFLTQKWHLNFTEHLKYIKFYIKGLLHVHVLKELSSFSIGTKTGIITAKT